MEQNHEAAAGTPSTPNLAQLELRGEASTVTHGASEDQAVARKVTDVGAAPDEPTNLRLLRIADAGAGSFCSNYIKTTKYTLLSYLPLATLYQYKKLANWYFLLQSVLSCTPISPWGPVTMVVPTVFVLVLAVLREGLEDYSRYQSDKQSNKQAVRRVRNDGSVEEITSGEVLVGDVIFVGDGEDIPADVVLLGGGIEQENQAPSARDAAKGGPEALEAQGQLDKEKEAQLILDDQAACFLQTSSLDGEKNLKKKVTPQGFKGISLEHLDLTGERKSTNAFPQLDGSILCDLPNNDLHQFNGSLTMRSPYSGKIQTYSLGPKQLLLKGSKLANTARGVLGVVVYTGLDTKLMQNQHNGRHKQSKLEKETNKIVVRLLILLTLVSVLLSWQSYRWDATEGDGQYYVYSHTKPEYRPSQNLTLNFFLNFLSSFLINSTFVPISLIVTLEVVKMLQGVFISWDFEMVRVEFDEGDIQARPLQEGEANQALRPKKQPISFQKCKVLTCSINEELGQVRYIFSDKTGTLTMNAMEFRLCKIGHHIYGDRQAEPYIGPKHMQDIVEERSMNSPRAVPKGHPQIEHRGIGLDSASAQSCMSQSSIRSTVNRKQGASYNYHNMKLEQILFGNEIGDFGQQEQLACDLAVHSKNGKASLVFGNQKKLISEFLQCLATTHECVPEAKTAKTDDGTEVPVVGYQGPSPDEVALLEFAQHHGFEYAKGTEDCLQVTKKHRVYNNMSNAQSFSSLGGPAGRGGGAELPQWVADGALNFKLLKRIEFSSDRKRMSVVVQDLQDGQYKLYCKGADNVIKERLREGYVRPGKPTRKHVDTPEPFELRKPQTEQQKEDLRMMDETDQFLQQCSMDGYRTLLVAMRVLDADEATQFVTECAKAESDIERKDENLAKVYDKWERELSLLGATVLEDRLQENVQSTIESLHQADIKVWVLTGDKLETAESIGFSSKLLTLGMDIMRCRNEEDVKDLFNRDSASKNEADILSGQKKALIIESEALKLILGNDNLKVQRYFLKITKTLETVICCRVSPRQKAEVVKLIKEDDPEVVTLAIGDGANDVSMILEADLGIGLFGNEGMRAADSSDFAICEFQHMWTLLFKQGRWLYARISFLVIYSLYKSFMYTIMQVLFARINCYSFQTVFPDFFLTMFNTWFTAWPVPFHSCIDLDIFPSKEPRADQDPLLDFEAYDPWHLRHFIPSLYFQGQRNVLFNQYTFLWWMIRGLYEGLITFFIIVEAFQESFILHQDGQPGDQWTMGITMFTCVMFIITFKILLKHKKIDWHVPACHLLLASVGNYFLYLWVTDTHLSFKNAFTFEFLFTSPITYLIVFLVVGLCFLIDFALESVSYNITTSSYDLIRYQTLEKGAEETQDFVDEFERLTTYQRNLGLIKDSVREQQLDYKRAIKAGLAPEELREEMRMNQMIERNLGGIKGLFQGMSMRFSAGSTRTTSKSASASSSMTRSYFDAGRRKQEPGPSSRGHRGSLKKDVEHKFGEAYGGKQRQAARPAGGGGTNDHLRQHWISGPERRKDAQDDMLEFAQATPKQARRGDTRVKTEKKSLMSTQKNLVSPLQHESYQGESPQRHSGTIFKECAGSPADEHPLRRTAQLSSIQKTPAPALSHQKSVPAPDAADILDRERPSLLGRKPHISSEGFINLHKARRSSNLADDHADVPRLDCFDRSFDGRRAGGRHHRRRSAVSSRINESIAEEVQGQRPHDQGVVRRGSDRPKYLEEEEQSARDSIGNLALDDGEMQEEHDRTGQDPAREDQKGHQPQ